VSSRTGACGNVANCYTLVTYLLTVLIPLPHATKCPTIRGGVPGYTAAIIALQMDRRTMANGTILCGWSCRCGPSVVAAATYGIYMLLRARRRRGGAGSCGAYVQLRGPLRPVAARCYSSLRQLNGPPSPPSARDDHTSDDAVGTRLRCQPCCDSAVTAH